MQTESPAPSPTEVLTQLLARGIEDQPAFFLRLDGLIGFEVEGDQSFVVRLGSADAPLAWGTDQAARLRLFTDRAGIERLLDGRFDPQAELASGALRLEGEVDLLHPLVQILTQGQSALDLRAGR